MSFTDNLKAFIEESNEIYFEGEVDQNLDPEEASEKYAISNKNQANWYLRKFKEIELQEAEIHDTASLELERTAANVKMWEENEIKKLQWDKQFFSGLLEKYAANQLKDSKKKTLSLPDGSVCFRKQQPEYIYDEKVLSEHLQGTPYLEVVQNFKVDKSTLKKDIALFDGKAYVNGKELPGITINERGAKFEIK